LPLVSPACRRRCSPRRRWCAACRRRSCGSGGRRCSPSSRVRGPRGSGGAGGRGATPCAAACSATSQHPRPAASPRLDPHPSRPAPPRCPRGAPPPPAELLARVPEDSLSRLQRLLNGPKSPLFSSEFQDAYARFARASVDARKGRPSSASRGAGGGTRRQRGFGGWGFDGLFGGTRSSGDEGERWDLEVEGSGEGRRRGGPALPSVSLKPLPRTRVRHPRATRSRVSPAPLPPGDAPAHGAPAAPPADPAGHYAALRISVTGGSPSDEDIRAAYRKLVMELHPDKQRGKSARQQRQARGRAARGAAGRRPLLLNRLFAPAPDSATALSSLALNFRVALSSLALNFQRTHPVPPPKRPPSPGRGAVQEGPARLRGAARRGAAWAVRRRCARGAERGPLSRRAACV
jgi:hypothetical protein